MLLRQTGVEKMNSSVNQQFRKEGGSMWKPWLMIEPDKVIQGQKSHAGSMVDGFSGW